MIHSPARSVGARHAPPAEELVDLLARDRLDHVPVGVHVVDHPEARVLEVAEDVLGEKRRREDEDEVQENDTPRHPPEAERVARE